MSQEDLSRYSDIRTLWAAESFELLLKRPPSAQALSRMREAIEVDARSANTEETPHP